MADIEGTSGGMAPNCTDRALLLWAMQAGVGVVTATVAIVTSERVRQALASFVEEREWAQFHTPANLAKSISIEAGELLECFQWSDDADAERVRDELADVVTYCILLAERLGVDLDEIVLEKLAVTEQKYPADRARGRSTKYDAL